MKGLFILILGFITMIIGMLGIVYTVSDFFLCREYYADNQLAIKYFSYQSCKPIYIYLILEIFSLICAGMLIFWSSGLIKKEAEKKFNQYSEDKEDNYKSKNRHFREEINEEDI